MERISQQAEVTLSPEEQERLKRAVCRFFSDKLTELEVTLGERTTDYVQRFYERCTGSTRPWTQQKEFDMVGLSLPLRIRFDQHSGYISENQRLDIDISPLLEAKDADALKQATLLILQDVYHEAEHIFVPGFPMQYGLDLEGPEQTVEYLCHHGEIQAFARQYAFRYANAYPGAQFELQKMQQLAEGFQGERHNHMDAYNYFVVFADPKKQDQYKHIANLAEVHRAIVLQTEKHLELLKRNI